MSAVLSITPDSFISSQRSLPSLVLSPTPPNTEKPPCCMATFCISSMMRTVFPTPAPPKSPILPPLRYGVRRSTTFIPVSNTSAFVDWSTNAGAGRCIGYRFSAFTGPCSSTGSPTTFNILPSTPLPTGTVIPSPVSNASVPLTRPSVESIAMHLTVFSPRCSATSAIRFHCLSLMVEFVIFMALYIAGRCPGGNSMSRTAPMTCVTLPIFFFSIFKPPVKSITNYKLRITNL